MCHEDYMLKAIDIARKGVDSGQSPFGACIVKDDKILAIEHNRVWKDCDITAHAEIVAIRVACAKIGSIDLSNATIYSTTEPCPMCFSAIHWAKISKIYYGTNIKDAKVGGFNELDISNEELKKLGDIHIEIYPDFLRDKCFELFGFFKAKAIAKTY